MNKLAISFLLILLTACASNNYVQTSQIDSDYLTEPGFVEEGQFLDSREIITDIISN